MILFALGGSRGFTLRDFEILLNLRQSRPPNLAAQSYGLNYPTEIARHASCQLPISSEH